VWAKRFPSDQLKKLSGQEAPGQRKVGQAKEHKNQNLWVYYLEGYTSVCLLPKPALWYLRRRLGLIQGFCRGVRPNHSRVPWNQAISNAHLRHGSLKDFWKCCT